MSTSQISDRFSTHHVIALLVVLLASFAYSVLLARILLWVWAVVTVFSIMLSLFVVYLFYRLVLAVERMSYRL
ncbi:hypothetical protein [Halosolutus gelatinilyticus]|uniref:hypothetical protein n=1 Tax=Halosolutus gelatinilyticus TaxID=2931975 RepID=UPI001FF1D5B8|nr:hypothetical protein [Halosolutus gelatinilyticus]